MDLAASLKIISKDGTERVTPFGPAISKGRQRVSMRNLDTGLSTPYVKIHSFTDEKKLSAGEIVPVNISLWPMGWNIKKGETMRLTIGAYVPTPMSDPSDGTAKVTIPKEPFTFMPDEKIEMQTLGLQNVPYPYDTQIVKLPNSINRGIHRIHIGGEYDSHITLPVITRRQ